MKIRTALTLKNTGVTAAIFLLCMLLISLVSERTRSATFFHLLKGEAVTKAHLFLQKRVDARIMQSIYLNNKEFINEVEVAVYTTDFRMLYHDAIHNDIVKEDRVMIDRILREHTIEFYTGKYQGVGLLYAYNGKNYIVTAAAYDGYGYRNLAELQKTLLALFAIGLLLLFAAGYFLARSALKPIRDIVDEAGSITGSKLDKRLPVRNRRDELGELSTAFNELLDRLEASFDAQKQFVSNVSHELRTPLAALTLSLDVALQKERTARQYEAAIGDALSDAHRMARLVDGLLNLARADYGKGEIKMEDIRLDELLLDVRTCILKAHPDYKVSLLFDQDEDNDDRLITVRGNRYLLNIAFANLIENNCKYAADRSSTVQIAYWDKWVTVRLSDNGVGMSAAERAHLFTLFYRGRQQAGVEGYGIGMALSRKILLLHSGRIAVHSAPGEGTTFVVQLPHV